MNNKLIKEALNTRAFEQNLLNSYAKGYLNGTVHTCIGQELFPNILANACSGYETFVVSNHRGHGHYLAFTEGKDLELLQEILGQKDGVSGGYGGSQHLYSENFLSNGIQGGMIPTLAGITKAKSSSCTNFVGIGFIGDGTLGQGVLYESLNFIGNEKLPIIIVLEDNGYAQSTSTRNWTKGKLEPRFKGFGFEYVKIDTTQDVKDQELGLREIVENASIGVPTVIHLLTTRLKSHSKGDDNRPDDFIQELTESDLLNKLQKSNIGLAEYYENRLDFYKGKTEEFIQFKSPSILIQKDQQSINPETLTSFQGTYNNLINQALQEILQRLPTSILIGEDIRDRNNPNEKDYGGAFKVTKGLSNTYGNRIINAPISEQLIIGFALGYSIYSEGAIAEIMFGDFLTLGLDQLLQHAAKFTKMYGRSINIPLIVRTPMGGKRGYGPTHSQSIEKHFLGIDGLNVIALNHRLCPKSVLRRALDTGLPTLLIENKILYTLKSRPLPPLYGITKVASDHILISSEESINISVFCYGENLNIAENAADALVEDEVFINIYCFHDLNSSLDTINTNDFENHHIITIEEGSGKAAWSGNIAKLILRSTVNINSFHSLSNENIIPSNAKAEADLLPNSSQLIELISKIYD